MKLSFASNSQNADQTLISLEDLKVIHLRRSVDSTQDEVKQLLLDVERPATTNQILAVLADDQSKGRGTSGRSWIASKGNLYMTCAVPIHLIPMKKITLLPLGVGIQIAETLADYMPKSKPTLKWPNDVLLDGLKVAGTLIENHTANSETFWLIGIGVNIETYPETLPKENDDFKAIPRSATSLRSHSKSCAMIPTAPEFAVALATRLQKFIKTIEVEDASSIVQAWKQFANMQTPYTLRNTGETVIVKDIQMDGQLKVIGEDGKERLLVADYFY